MAHPTIRLLAICLSAFLLLPGCRKAPRGTTQQEGAAPPSTENPTTPPARPDEERLQGEWIIQRHYHELNGNPNPQPLGKNEHLVIAGDRLTWFMPEDEIKIEYRFTLAAGKEQKAIDLTLQGITEKGQPFAAKAGKDGEGPIAAQYRPGMVFPGVYRLLSEPMKEDELELYFPWHPAHLERPSVKFSNDTLTAIGRWTALLETKRVRTMAEKEEYVRPRANGISIAEERAVFEVIDSNRQSGAEHEPRIQSWESAELTDKKGVKRKIIRVKFHYADSTREQDILYWVENGQSKRFIPDKDIDHSWWPERAEFKKLQANRFGDDWKAKAADLDWDPRH